MAASDAPAATEAPFRGFTPAALQFLADLAQNNSRDWFKPRKTEYDELVREPMEALCAALAERFAALDLPLMADPRRSLFRIYRDVRFSKDKSPYKTHQGASFPWVGQGSAVGQAGAGDDTSGAGGAGGALGAVGAGGEAGAGAGGGAGGRDERGERSGGVGGYFHLEPGQIFVGGGMWHPERARLAAFREVIDRDPNRALKAIEDERFRSVFKGVTGDSLTRNPQGFPKDHAYSHLLRLKDVTFSRRLSDQEVFSPKLPDTIARDLDAARPVFRFLAALAGAPGHTD